VVGHSVGAIGRAEDGGDADGDGDEHGRKVVGEIPGRESSSAGRKIHNQEQSPAESEGQSREEMKRAEEFGQEEDGREDEDGGAEESVAQLSVYSGIAGISYLIHPRLQSVNWGDITRLDKVSPLIREAHSVREGYGEGLALQELVFSTATHFFW
jgi:hypothetical protein